MAKSVLLALALIGCTSATTPNPDVHAPMDAASGVTRADGGKGTREHRIIPLSPMSGDVEILYGNPETPGEPFVMRIHELPGAIVPPHTHPVDENITVVQGTWYFGFGDTFDPTQLHELATGSYAFAPKGSSMFGFSPNGAIVQIHGIGPFSIHWHGGLHTLDDPDANRTFRFKKGMKVDSTRGSGTIFQGYASGKVVQYEIEDANGTHFMENEDAVRSP